MDGFPRDLRLAVRTLRKQPTFVLTTICTLALGIGASAAMFGIVDAALLRPLPFHEPRRLAILWGVYGTERSIRGASPLEIGDWSRRNHSFEAIAIYDAIPLNLRTTNGAERIAAEMVSPSYFSILGATPRRGRTFFDEEDRTPDTHPVAVISDAMWRARFSADPAVVGRTLTLNDRVFTIVGVMQPDFRGLSFVADLWIPTMMLSVNSSPGILESRRNRWLAAVGRLAPGQTLASAQRDLDAVARQLAAEYPGTNTDRGVQLFSLTDNYLGGTRQLLLALLGAVGLLLLIGCTNVVALQLVRAAGRRREMALRLALGASRLRLARQLVAEGVVLSLAGALVGVLLAFWCLDAFVALAPDGVLPKYVNPAIDVRVLAFSLGLGVVCGVVFGLAPAWRSSRLELADALRRGTRGSTAGMGSIRRPGAQQILVIAEVAVALVLLVGAGLLVRSLRGQLDVDPGFQPAGVLTARITFPPTRYAPTARTRFVDQMLGRVVAFPTVRSAAVGSDTPLGNNLTAGGLFVPDAGIIVRAYRHSVTPDYFATLGISVVRGRSFTREDAGDSSRAAIVSEATARRFWPGQDPLGKRIRVGDEKGAEKEIVGVVGNARFQNLTQSLATTEPDVYFPYAARAIADIELAIRTDGDPATLVPALRREVAAVDPGLPIFNVRLLTTQLRLQTASARFGSWMLSAFGVTAVLLAAVGIYGLLAFLVGLSRREIAIRLALGASRRNVLRRVVAHGASLAAAGVAVGSLGSVLASRALATQLYGVGWNDPMTFAVVLAIMAVVAFAASYLPARRAAAVDPQLALSAE